MNRNLRLPALRRFALAISALTILGHLVLGFEQSWAQVLVAVLCTCGTELLLERVHAWSQGRPSRVGATPRAWADFFVSSYIPGLAIAMLLYAQHSLMPFVCAAVVAIASKSILRAPTPEGSRHFLNPSNTGISTTLLLFPWVGIAPPYQFTENLEGNWDWFLPGVILCLGTFLNWRFTRRLPLVLGWIGGFLAQAILRAALMGTPLAVGLLPMTGVTFLLYTFYMIPDPGTTPDRPWAQATFGALVAATYAVLMLCHVAFGLFFALLIVCSLRGALLWITALAPRAPVATHPGPELRTAVT